VAPGVEERPFESPFIASSTWNVDHGFIRLGGFVVMSDHYHPLLSVVGEKALKIIAGIDWEWFY